MSDSLIPSFLLSAKAFGVHLGLTRMIDLMSKLGDPQNNLRVFHIAGTNGKGSVAAYLSTILACDGNTVGVFTSPYLERFSERIRILDGQDSVRLLMEENSYGEIPNEDLYKLSEKVQQAVTQMLAEDKEHPTEFELVTAAAFLYFAQENCDYVVLETGLGGRLDSTNIIFRPVCSLITSIGFDHMDYLGSTISEIAAEKAGIIKQDCPVHLYSPYDSGLCSEEADQVCKVIEEKCAEMCAPLSVISGSNVLVRQIDRTGQCFSLDFFERELHINMRGFHQVLNAALAVRAVLPFVSNDLVCKGLESTVWNGRAEIVKENPLVILDGAHNAGGMKSFCDTINELFYDQFSDTPPRMIIGILKDKEYEKMLEVLFSSIHFPVKSVICVNMPQERALTGRELADTLRCICEEHRWFYNESASMYNMQDKIYASDDPKASCFSALQLSYGDHAPIICVGSLYLVGNVREIFIGNDEGESYSGLE